MPQLDALTYISQFVYLCITFGLSYTFALNFVIPRLVSILKLRQKLNTIAQVSYKLDRSERNDHESLPRGNATTVSGFQQQAFSVHDVVQDLGQRKWYARSQRSKLWPISASALVIMSTLKLKKILCNVTVAPVKY